jgi:hypothetical protein
MEIRVIINHRKGESYQHAAAKAVFKYWLDNSGYDFQEFGPFSWRGYGALEEYPFIDDGSSQSIVWTEKDYNIPMKNPPVPSYEELIAVNIKPIAIADIVIVHKGLVMYIIEIVHKNDVSEKKLIKLKALYTNINTEIWRVEAHWILSQIERPTNFPEACIRRID